MRREGCNRHRGAAILYLALAVSAIAGGSVAEASINIEFRPTSQAVVVGDTVDIELYVVSDSDADQLLAAAQVILAWDPQFLQLLGNDDTGAVPLLSSGFPANDPFNLNEQVPPQDGDGLYVAFAPLGQPVAATPKGTLLTTFQFLALAETPNTDLTYSSCACSALVRLRFSSRRVMLYLVRTRRPQHGRNGASDERHQRTPTTHSQHDQR